MEPISLNSLPEVGGVKNYAPLFIIETANAWIERAKTTPVPSMLFDVFWHESEICILFADTNLGKSILAVQIGESIAEGKHIPGFRFEGVSKKVIYYDFELSQKQFEARYSEAFTNHFHFSDNFLRCEINPEAVLPEEFSSFDDYLNASLEFSIVETGAKILIIDNLTYLRQETEKAKDALPLMKHLKALKSKYGLSILALAHTPKRDLSKPITRNDLAGSKMLINFCDSAFTVGECANDGSLRYLKQIKARNTEIAYGADNVGLCQISKNVNFLEFQFMGFSRESDHLRQPSEKEEASLNDKIMELKSEGKSLREIGAALGVSHTKVARILKQNGTV